VHALPAVNSQLNERSRQGNDRPRSFRQAGTHAVQDQVDVHGWMKSYMAVMPHPFYAVKAMNGPVHDSEPSAGTLHAVAWHRSTASRSRAISVARESRSRSHSAQGIDVGQAPRLSAGEGPASHEGVALVRNDRSSGVFAVSSPSTPSCQTHQFYTLFTGPNFGYTYARGFVGGAFRG